MLANGLWVSRPRLNLEYWLHCWEDACEEMVRAAFRRSYADRLGQTLQAPEIFLIPWRILVRRDTSVWPNALTPTSELVEKGG